HGGRRRLRGSAAEGTDVGHGAPSAVRADRAVAAMSRDRGAYTAELATSMPALVLLFVVGLTAVDVLITKVRCVDAARDAARAVARGESPDSLSDRYGPSGATVSVTIDGEL